MTPKNNDKFLKKKLSVCIKGLSGVSLIVGAMGLGAPAFAQDDASMIEELVVTGQRGSIQSAQMLKQNAEQIVDSIVSDDIGKLPDRSITEAIQRISGVTIEKFMSINDPEHFSAEGSGVAIRGMKHVRSELNGRDTFSASGGRSLSFEDVPAELMAGVDVYKNPSADMIEGGLGGTVNLRTKMPLDMDGQKISVSASANYGNFVEDTRPSYSGLYSNKWDTDAGEFGLLVDVAYSDLATRTDGIFNRPMFARTDIVEGEKVWVPKGADWRTMEYQRERLGTYVAFQWRPSEEHEFYATAFQSKYDMQWDEDAIFVNNDPWSMEVENAVFDKNGVFQSGRLVDPGNGGMSYGADIRASTRESKTTDFSGGWKWTPSDNVKFNLDLQYTKSTNDSLDVTVATGIDLPYLDLDLTGGLPNMSTDVDYLADIGNYYWAFTMPHVEESEAEQFAVRADVEFSFDDSVWRSVKVGVRATDRSADNIDTGYNWQPIYQSYMKGWKIGDEMPKITAEEQKWLSLNTYDNFFRGDAKLNGVVWAPNVDLALGYPGSLNDLHESAIPNYTCAPGCYDYKFRDKNEDDWQNIQDENTYSIYALGRFGFDDWAVPMDGNIGVRVVQTDMTASGWLIYPDFAINEAGDKPFNAPSEQLSFDNKYTHVLPSLNLRWTLRDDLYARFAASQAIARPDFNQLKAVRILGAKFPDGQDASANIPPSDVLLTADVQNPNLRPIEADQFDVSLEWYFDDRGGMIYGTVFHKDLSGIIRETAAKETYNDWTYTVKRPENVGSAKITGFEVGYNQFFDMLPEPFDGLGMQVNYTYIDSSTKIPPSVNTDGTTVVPVDTDGTPFSGTQPYEGLSEHSYNIVGMYEKGPISVRLAWSWRSEYLMSIGANGYNGTDGGVSGSQGHTWRLPVWSDDSGQLDGSVFYSINDNLSVGLEMNNLTNAETRTIMKQQGAGDRYTSFFVNDTRYALTLRANF